MLQAQKSDQINGYVTLTSLLVVAAILLVVGISVSLLTISNSQMALVNKKSTQDLYLIESCAEDALLKLRDTDNIPATITLPNGSCTITINSHVGNNWDFTITSPSLVYPKSIQVICSRTSTVTITSWKNI